MKKTANLIKALVFILLLGAISVSIYRMLAWKDTKGISGLYDCPDHSADVLFVGSSHDYCTINTATLWDEQGIAAADISEGGQNLVNSYHYLKEALKTQRPRVVMLELRGIDMMYRMVNGNVYRNTLNMKWSENYFKNAEAAVKKVREDDSYPDNMDAVKKGIFLKFPTVHTRYSELVKDDFTRGEALRYAHSWTRHAYKAPAALQNTQVTKLTGEQRETLDAITALAGEYGFELVLWVAPYVVNDTLMQQFNAVEQYAGEKGITFYGMRQIVSETGFDFSNDMRREQNNTGSHMNNDGAVKVTAFIGKVLGQYGLPDRRNEKGYDWYEQLAREWRVSAAARTLSTARTLQDYAAGIDHTLFDTTVIDFTAATREKTRPAPQPTESPNLITNPDTFEGWYVTKPQYTGYPEPGVVQLSASGVKDFSYVRFEGPLSLSTEELLGEEKYVLSFEMMSPDWSAVEEPTTDKKGPDALAFVFSTSEETPLGKVMAYRFIRLGQTDAKRWQTMPEPVDGEWLRYVSVPLTFDDTKRSWSYLDRGLGRYVRVGPQLRANGTVYFRNICLKKAGDQNTWPAILDETLSVINDKETFVPGLYTDGRYNATAGVWQLTADLTLKISPEDPKQLTLYSGSKETAIEQPCDVYVMVTDKKDGRLVRQDRFSLEEEGYMRK